MGTEISLSFGGIDLEWSKNSRGADHGSLFQAKDRGPVLSDQIDYDYFKRQGEDPAPMEMAFARKPGDLVGRLDLLGFTLDQARVAYERWAHAWLEEQSELTWDGKPCEIPAPLTFEEYKVFLLRHPVADLDSTYVEYSRQDKETVKGRFVADAATIARIPTGLDHDTSGYSERSFFGNAVGVLHPYFMLRLFAELPANRATDVVWQYGPLVKNGWAKTSEFNPLARRTETFLIATEGSSDAHILKHALELLRPDVMDFFRFIDVTERHPFAGTGNLVKFAEGLAKIDVHNQTLFVFDNDAEGVEAYRKVASLALPLNMRAMLLPDLQAFTSFPTHGPEGDRRADINGRRAAIECYLDHRLKDFPPPRVIWTNYKEGLGLYHGALEHKETYSRAFIKLGPEQLAGYDILKLKVVLDALVSECVAMASADLAQRFELQPSGER